MPNECPGFFPRTVKIYLLFSHIIVSSFLIIFGSPFRLNTSSAQNFPPDSISFNTFWSVGRLYGKSVILLTNVATPPWNVTDDLLQSGKRTDRITNSRDNCFGLSFIVLFFYPSTIANRASRFRAYHIFVVVRRRLRGNSLRTDIIISARIIPRSPLLPYGVSVADV